MPAHQGGLRSLPGVGGLEDFGWREPQELIGCGPQGAPFPTALRLAEAEAMQFGQSVLRCSEEVCKPPVDDHRHSTRLHFPYPNRHPLVKVAADTHSIGTHG